MILERTKGHIRISLGNGSGPVRGRCFAQLGTHGPLRLGGLFMLFGKGETR